jgi:hypothetical protein
MEIQHQNNHSFETTERIRLVYLVQSRYPDITDILGMMKVILDNLIGIQ